MQSNPSTSTAPRLAAQSGCPFVSSVGVHLALPAGKCGHECSGLWAEWGTCWTGWADISRRVGCGEKCSWRYANSYCFTLLDSLSKASSMFEVDMHILRILSFSVWVRTSGCQAVHVSQSARLIHISFILLSFTTIAGRAVSIVISKGLPGNAGNVMICFSSSRKRSYMHTVLSTRKYRVNVSGDAARTTFSRYFDGGGQAAILNAHPIRTFWKANTLVIKENL